MTALDDLIGALRALEEKGTKGKWSASPREEHADVCLYCDDGSWLANVGNWARGQDPLTHAQPETIEFGHVDNAALVAAARNALPLLLDLAALAVEAREILNQDDHRVWYDVMADEHENEDVIAWLARFDALAGPLEKKEQR